MPVYSHGISHSYFPNIPVCSCGISCGICLRHASSFSQHTVPFPAFNPSEPVVRAILRYLQIHYAAFPFVSTQTFLKVNDVPDGCRLHPLHRVVFRIEQTVTFLMGVHTIVSEAEEKLSLQKQNGGTHMNCLCNLFDDCNIWILILIVLLILMLHGDNCSSCCS